VWPAMELSRRQAWAITFVATFTMAVSYIDRQTLSVLAPTVSSALHLSETDYGWLASGIVWWIAGFRLARPESWWACHLYGPAKLARAEARYPETLAEEEGIDGEPDPPWVRVATALFIALCAVAAILAVGGLLGL